MGELQNLEKDAVKVYTFTKSHIWLTVALVIALVFGAYQIEAKYAAIADGRAQVAEQKAKDAEAHAAQVVAQDQQVQIADAAKEAANQQQISQLQTMVDTLTKAVAARNQQLATQQKTDATLSPTDQSARWISLVPQAVVAPTAQGFAINAAGGLATIQQLESVPVLTKNVADLTQTVADEHTQLTLAQASLSLEGERRASVIDANTATVAALNLKIDAGAADLKACKADSRKKSLKYMLAGGFIVEIVRVYFTGRP